MVIRTSFYLVNNSVLVLIVVGLTNLWVQSGMKARDVTLLGVGLTVYDYAATAASSVMATLLDHLSGLPFAPMIGWQVSPTLAGSIGLGDLLLGTILPLLMWKAFCRAVGITAIGMRLAGFVVIFGLMTYDHGFPAMVVLGPGMLAQYLFWPWGCGSERTTRQFRQPVARLNVT